MSRPTSDKISHRIEEERERETSGYSVPVNMYIVSPCLHLCLCMLVRVRVRAMLLSVHFDILRRFFSIKVTKIEVHCVAFVVVVVAVICCIAYLRCHRLILLRREWCGQWVHSCVQYAYGCICPFSSKVFEYEWMSEWVHWPNVDNWKLLEREFSFQE